LGPTCSGARSSFLPSASGGNVARAASGSAAMLHKCVATNRCCPKLHEANLGAEGEQHSTHYYSDPYLHEDPRVINAVVGEEGGTDFPAYAMALMYDPTSAQPEEQPEEPQSEDEEEGLSVGNESAGFVEDVDDFMSVPQLVSSSPPTRIPSSLGGALRLATGTTGPSAAPGPARGGRCIASGPLLPVAPPEGIGEEGSGAGRARSSSAPRSAAPSTFRPLPAAKNTQVGGASGSEAQPQAEFANAPQGNNCVLKEVEGKAANSATSLDRLGHFEPATDIKLDRSFPGPGSIAAGGGRPSSAWAHAQASSQTSVPRPPLASSMASPSPEQGAHVHRQHKTLSRSLREARACKSEAGAASIAAILQVVAHVQEASTTPCEPGREHWHDQPWVDCAADRQLVSLH